MNLLHDNELTYGRLLPFEGASGDPFSPFTGRRWPEGSDEGQRHAWSQY